MERWMIVLAGLLLWLSIASAQEPFEVHSYEYEPVKIQDYSFEGPAVQPAKQAHPQDHAQLSTKPLGMTLGATMGWAGNFVLGFLFLNAWEQGLRICATLHDQWRSTIDSLVSLTRRTPAAALAPLVSSPYIPRHNS
jgi:hypothetical protein